MAIIEFAGETLESTDDHPFWVVAGSQLDHRPSPRHVPAIEPNAALPGRWVDAGDLRRSDLLHLRDGRRVPIRSARTRPADETVYNFEVTDLHTFAVGAAEALVHNRDPKTVRAKTRLAKELGGIPKSAQPIAQGRFKGVQWWEYLDSSGKRKIVVVHTDGSVHVGVPKPQSLHLDGQGPPKYYQIPGSGHVGDD
jgi:hypothetical protein